MKVTVLYGLEPQEVWQKWKEKRRKNEEALLCAQNYAYILLLLKGGNYLENADFSVFRNNMNC